METNNGPVILLVAMATFQLFICICMFLIGALRFLRRMVGLKDDTYNRYIVRSDLFRPVIEAFIANGISKYNLFNSAVVELCEFLLNVTASLLLISVYLLSQLQSQSCILCLLLDVVVV